MHLVKASSAGRLKVLKWDFEVISGNHAGRRLFKNSVISQAALPFVKRDLQTLGLTLARFSHLSDSLHLLLDKTLEVTKKTNGEYTNVYLNKQIELPAGVNPDPVPF